MFIYHKKNNNYIYYYIMNIKHKNHFDIFKVTFYDCILFIQNSFFFVPHSYHIHIVFEATVVCIKYLK